MDVFLQIVDSSGEVMAKSKRSGASLNNQVLQFAPAPYFVAGRDQQSIRKHISSTDYGESWLTATVRYYLQLIPVESTPPTTPITFTLQINGGVPFNIYLPAVMK